MWGKHKESDTDIHLPNRTTGTRIPHTDSELHARVAHMDIKLLEHRINTLEQNLRSRQNHMHHMEKCMALQAHSIIPCTPTMSGITTHPTIGIVLIVLTNTYEPCDTRLGQRLGTVYTRLQVLYPVQTMKSPSMVLMGTR